MLPQFAMTHLVLFVSLLLFMDLSQVSAQDVGLESQPIEPGNALSMLHVREGYRVELMAAEPLVQDPVAINWDADGRLWVAEMADYPLGVDGKGKPGGRVRWLRDSNGDGQYNESVVFSDKLSFPSGVLPWRDGVFVTAAPQILFLRDTDDDGLADKREVVYTGFREDNQQLRVNGLRWGLDNRIYCASGANSPGRAADTKIRCLKTGEVVELGSRDFCFDPRTGKLDPVSGPTQFGRNRDDWGNWFGTMNSYPLWHYVLEDHYMRRNSHFTPPDLRKQLIMPRNPRLYPAKTPQKRYKSFQHLGHYTSACSGMIYRDEILFGRDDRQHAFTCAPFHNLVQHNILSDDSVSFSAMRDKDETAVDFFASRDRWCRPVMARTGPDGALWVVDMYRYMIEHPQFLTDEGQAELKPHYRAGHNRGRIYRVFPEDIAPRSMDSLHGVSTHELMNRLESPNGPERDLIQQELITRSDRGTIQLLETRSFGSPQARLHALCILDGLDALAAPVLMRALRDDDPRVRRRAVLLAEKPGLKNAALRAAVQQLVPDSDAKVRLQLACTLGEWPDDNVSESLGQLAVRDAGDQFATAAIMSSLNQSTIDMVLKIVLAARSKPETGALAGRLLALSAAMGKHEAIVVSILEFVEPDNSENHIWQFSTLAGLLDALDQRGTSLTKVTSTSGERGVKATALSKELTKLARAFTFDTDEADEDRGIAMRLLARDVGSRETDIQSLAALLNPRTSVATQLAVVSHLGNLPHPNVADVLLKGWSSHGPQVRAAVLGALLTNADWVKSLLEAIANKQVVASDIDAGNRQTLLVVGNREQRARTASLLNETLDVDRRRVVDQHRRASELTGNTARGKVLFGRHCVTCHRLDGKGNDVGPNLVSVTDKRPVSLLTSILNPSAAVDAKHVMYIALTQRGQTFSGILTTESANSIGLTTQDNKQQIILRRDLEELQSTGKSLMPDGFEKQLNDQDLADVISYVAGPHQQ